MKMPFSALASRAILLAGACKYGRGWQDRALWAFLGGENKQRICTPVLLLRLLAHYGQKVARKCSYPLASRAILLTGGRKHSRVSQDRGQWVFLGGENKTCIFNTQFRTRRILAQCCAKMLISARVASNFATKTHSTQSYKRQLRPTCRYCIYMHKSPGML